MLTSLGFVGIGYLAEYASRVFIAQAWGAKELGVFATGMSLAYLVSAIGLFGLPNAYSRKAASAIREERSAIFTATFVIFLIVWVAVIFLVKLFLPEFFAEWKYFLFLSPLLGLYRLGVVHFSVLHKRSLGIFYQEVMNRAVRLAALFLLFIMAREQFIERIGEMLFWTFFIVTAFLIVHQRIVYHLRFIIPTRQIAKAVALSAMPLSIGVISQVSAGRLEFILPGMFGGVTSRELGLFAAYMVFGQLLLMPSQIVTFNSTPKISRLNDVGSFVDIQRYVYQCIRKISMMCVPMFLVFIIFGDGLIGLLFGEEFSGQGRTAFIIVISGYLFFSISSPVVNYLIGTGAYAGYVWSSAISMLVRILFITVLLSAGLGLNGLAVGSMLGFLVYALLLGSALYQRIVKER